jgi:hydrogenase maturation factor
MADLVDIVIPAIGQTAAEALGLKVHRSVTTGTRVRQISREDAEIAVECLRDWGVSARIVGDLSRPQPALEHGAASASRVAGSGE